MLYQAGYSKGYSSKLKHYDYGKEKDEKDVLVVRDEKTGEISVVTGLNADGTPKRTPAKAENAQSFLQFDRHGDVLDNFFKNFFQHNEEWLQPYAAFCYLRDSYGTPDFNHWPNKRYMPVRRQENKYRVVS